MADRNGDRLVTVKKSGSTTNFQTIAADSATTVNFQAASMSVKSKPMAAPAVTQSVNSASAQAGGKTSQK